MVLPLLIPKIHKGRKETEDAKTARLEKLRKLFASERNLMNYAGAKQALRMGLFEGSLKEFLIVISVAPEFIILDEKAEPVTFIVLQEFLHDTDVNNFVVAHSREKIQGGESSGELNGELSGEGRLLRKFRKRVETVKQIFNVVTQTHWEVLLKRSLDGKDLDTYASDLFDRSDVFNDLKIHIANAVFKAETNRA